MHNVRRLSVVMLLALWVTPARADDSLARVTPPDVGLFVELQRGTDLLLPLVEPQVWLTLAQLTGQPAALAETEQWRRRVEQTVDMPPAEAIRTLFARRVAFVAEGWRATQDAAILCEPPVAPQALLGRWKARPQPYAGRSAVYRLPYNVGLAVHGDLFVFGDVAPQGLFEHILRFQEQSRGPALADDPVYAQLLRRVPPLPDGVLFARFDRPADTRPSAASATRAAPSGRDLLPRPLRGSSNILLALHRNERLLHIDAVGDATPGAPAPDGPQAALIANLPAQTLLGWAGPVDYPDLARTVTALPETSLYRMVFEAQARSGVVGSLTSALHPTACVALGSVVPSHRAAPAPPIPAAAVLLAARDPDTASREWARLVSTTLALYKLLALKLASPPNIPPIAAVTVADVPAQHLDLGGLLGPEPGQTPLGELHLTWALDGDVLIIASHADWLRQIIAARHGQGARLASVLELSQHAAAEQQETIFVAQPGPLADLGRLWLAYFERVAPYVLSEKWWRSYQPGGESVRLGVQATTNADHQSLVVQSVTPNSPAVGIVRPGDEIIGCNQRRFATSQPIVEIQAGLAERPNARWFDVLVERSRVIRVKRIPLPFVDPVEVLQRLISIGQVVQRVVYFDNVPDPAGSRGHLTVELRAGTAPLIDFAKSPPAVPVTRPTVKPVPPANHSPTTESGVRPTTPLPGKS